MQIIRMFEIEGGGVIYIYIYIKDSMYVTHT